MRSRGGEKFRPPMAEIHRKDGSWLSDCTTNGIVVVPTSKAFLPHYKDKRNACLLACLLSYLLAGAEPNLYTMYCICDLALY